MSSFNKTLYVGVTNNLIRRVYEHKNHLVDGFTDKYNITNLVYFECYDDIKIAIEREKQIKRWNRNKKLDLICTKNNQFKDIYSDIL